MILTVCPNLQVWLRVLVGALAFFVAACDAPEERADSFRERGQALFEEGKYTKARLELKNALQIDPRDLEAIYYLGRINEKSGDLRRAYRAFSTISSERPDHVDANLALARIFLFVQDFDQAMEKANAVIGIDAENSEAHAVRGAIFAKWGQLTAAKYEAEAALSADPANKNASIVLSSVYRKEGKHAKAIKLLDESIRLNSNNVVLRVMKIVTHLSQKKPEEAAAALRELIKVAPDNFSYRSSLAKLYIALGRLDDAEQVLRDAVAKAPDDDEPKLALVAMLVNQRNASDANRELADFINQSPDNFALRLRLAELYEYQGLRDRAEAVYLEDIERGDTEPIRLAARTALARVRYSGGDTAAAEDLVATILREDPSNSESLILHARLLLEKGAATDAISDLRSVLRDDPESRDALILLANAYTRTDNLELATDVLYTLVGIAPRNDEVRLLLAQVLARQGNLDIALNLIDQILEREPESESALRSQAEVLIARKDLGQATLIARRIAEKPETQALGQMLLGRIYLVDGRYNEAVAAFTKALDFASGEPDALPGLVQSYLAQNQHEQAAQYLEHLIASAPDNAFAHSLLGKVRALQDRDDLAKQAFLQAAKLRPERRTSYANLGKLLLGAGDAQGALEAFQNGLSHFPQDEELMFGLALAYRGVGDYEASASTYEAMLVRNSLDVVANNLAALIVEYQFQDSAKLDRALGLVERFGASDNPRYLDTLGWVHYRMGNFDQALTFLESAVEKAPSVPEMLYHLGMAKYRSGQFSQARQDLEKAVSNDADYPGIDQARAILASLPADE